MPGFSFIFDQEGRLRPNDPDILKGLDALLHDERCYARTVLRQDNYYFLASTGYKEYPVESFQSGDVSIYLEGYLFGTGAAARMTKLGELAEIAFGAGSAERERTLKWLSKCDGDYVIFLFQDKTGEAVIVNDPFSQLPLYCYRTPGTLIVSRELRFIANRMNPVRFDRMALAQYLLFGFPLGARTLLENVQRLAPATRLYIHREKSTIQLDRIDPLNVQAKEHAASSIEENAAALAALLSAACRTRRVPGMEHVLSSSGGLDSRCIAAGLHREGIPFSCVTFLDHVGIAARDVPVARRLAQLLGVDWTLFELGPPGRRDVLTLLRIKNGMNPLGMAFLLPFLDAVRNSFELPVFFLTGVGGLATLLDPRSPIPLTALDTLVEYLIAQYGKFSLQDVSALTGFTRADIFDELRQHLLSYPEREWGEKYVHFTIAERALNWHSEGEDRNRFFFWSTTPFYDIDFFTYALNCPNRQRTGYGLYREILRRLSPPAAELEHAGIGAAVTSSEFDRASRVAALLAARPDRRKKLKEALGLVSRYDGGSTLLRYLSRQLAKGDSIFEYLSAAALNDLVEHHVDHSVEEFDHLFTITSIIEDLTTGKSVLEE